MPAGAFAIEVTVATVVGLTEALALKLDKLSAEDLVFSSASKGVVFLKPNASKARMTLDNDNAPNMNAVA